MLIILGPEGDRCGHVASGWWGRGRNHWPSHNCQSLGCVRYCIELGTRLLLIEWVHTHTNIWMRLGTVRSVGTAVGTVILPFPSHSIITRSAQVLHAPDVWWIWWLPNKAPIRHYDSGFQGSGTKLKIHSSGGARHDLYGIRWKGISLDTGWITYETSIRATMSTHMSDCPPQSSSLWKHVCCSAFSCLLVAFSIH